MMEGGNKKVSVTLLIFKIRYILKNLLDVVK